MKLTYSSVDQPELVGYLALLEPFEPSLEVEEIIGYGGAKLVLAAESQAVTDLKCITMELAKMSQSPLSASVLASMDETMKARYEQVFALAYDTVVPSLHTGRPDPNVAVFEVLNAMLEKTVYVLGDQATPADALLFALLHTRIRAFVPMLLEKHFRLVRWFSQFQHDWVVKAVKLNSSGSKIAAAFPVVAFDLAAVEKKTCPLGSAPTAQMAALKVSSAQGKEAEAATKTAKAPKAPKEAVAKKASAEAAVASDLPPIGRIDLRVGRIVEIEKHPTADRLFVEKVDLGEAEPRTVVSGLVGEVPIEELQGRLCVFVCNLKPAMLCKVQSCGMILVGKNDAALQVLVVPEGAKPGDRVGIEGVTEQPDVQIKPAKTGQLSVWDEARKDLAVDGEGRACYAGKPLIVKGEGVKAAPLNILHSTTVSNGIIS